MIGYTLLSSLSFYCYDVLSKHYIFLLDIKSQSVYPATIPVRVQSEEHIFPVLNNMYKIYLAIMKIIGILYTHY